VSDVLQDDLVGGERCGSPVDVDEGKHLMLDGGTWGIVADMDS
jgi:hypothetical protein